MQTSANKTLEGRIALITGGTSGIGLATARRLLAEGACVSVAARGLERLDAVRRDLAKEFGAKHIHAVECDVTDAASVESAFAEVARRWGRLDILVNNAGLSFGGSLEETRAADYDRQNDVMPRGSFLCSQQASRLMREQGRGGDIVYVVSKNALYAGPKNVAYGTAKAAQLHQARLLAAELAEFQIRVNVVNPDGVVRGSGIFADGWGEARAKAYGVTFEELGQFYAQRSLLKREILPEDVAAAIYVLVGPDLRKSTGLVINVDGGFPPTFLR